MQKVASINIRMSTALPEPVDVLTDATSKADQFLASKLKQSVATSTGVYPLKKQIWIGKTMPKTLHRIVSRR